MPRVYIARSFRDFEDGRYVVKRASNHELTLLSGLKWSFDKAGFGNIIPLLDTGTFQSGYDFIVQPLRCPIERALSPPSIKAILPLSRGLLSGTSFLHRCMIAHMDIKPDNLVYKPTRGGDLHIEIIDFDVSLKLKFRDETSSKYLGSPGYMVPEVQKLSHRESTDWSESQDGTDTDVGAENRNGTCTEKEEYSPIRADRYSVGRVLLYFTRGLGAEKCKGLVEFARKLTNERAENRPDLLEWSDGEDHGKRSKRAAPDSNPGFSKRQHSSTYTIGDHGHREVQGNRLTPAIRRPAAAVPAVGA